VITCGSDTLLGCWSFLELIGKLDKKLIIISAYCICDQKFNAAAVTVMAQQTRLLQAQGVLNPNPRKLFLTDLIHQIQA